MTVVSLKQRYDGHAKRAALVAAGNAYMGRIVVVRGRRSSIRPTSMT